jgi:biopolymer transport protein ExbD
MHKRARNRSGLIAGINITPLTDVALNLLLIFMIATPLIIQSGMKVNLPKAVAAEATPPRSITIAVDSTGAAYLEGRSLSPQELGPRLSEILSVAPDSSVIVLGDAAVRYEAVVRVLDIARGAGASKISIGVEKTSDKKR